MDYNPYCVKSEPDQAFQGTYFPNTLCWTCLASDRKVFELGSLKDIYCHLMRFQSLDMLQDSIWLEAMRVCWECSALLRRVSEFHIKAVKASEMLDTVHRYGMNMTFQTLSSLRVATCDTYTAHLYEDNIELLAKDNIFENDVKIDFEVLGSDYSDQDDIKNVFNEDFYRIESKNNESATGSIKTESIFTENVKIEPKESKNIKKRRRKQIKPKKIKCKSLGTKKVMPKIMKFDEYKCDLCQKAFKYKNGIKFHVRNKHGFDTPHTCKKCNKVLANTMKFNYHMNTEHKGEPEELRYCVECNKTYKTISLYGEHCKTKHGPPMPKKPKQIHPCIECGKTFTLKVNMRNHYKLIHEKKTDHYCPEHDRYFFSKGKLKEHIKSVHEGIPLPKNKICPHCGRGFGDQTILANHIRTHTGEKPFACPHCTSAFSQKSAMTHHVKKVHVEGWSSRRVKKNESLLDVGYFDDNKNNLSINKVD